MAVLYLLFKAYQPGLFDEQVTVSGHVTKRGTVVAPYRSTRKKRPAPPPPDLFAEADRRAMEEDRKKAEEAEREAKEDTEKAATDRLPPSMSRGAAEKAVSGTALTLSLYHGTGTAESGRQMPEDEVEKRISAIKKDGFKVAPISKADIKSGDANGRQIGDGVYLSEKREHAKRYGKVIEVKVKVNKIWEGTYREWITQYGRIQREAKKEGYFEGKSPSERITIWAKKNGYEGIRQIGLQTVIFDPRKITVIDDQKAEEAARQEKERQEREAEAAKKEAERKAQEEAEKAAKKAKPAKKKPPYGPSANRAAMAANEIDRTMTFYHGTAAKAGIDKLKAGIVFLSPDPQNARMFAESPILSGSATGDKGGGKPRLIQVAVTPGKIKDISREVDDAIFNDEDPDPIIEKEAKKAINEGFEYVKFAHPGHDGDDFFALVSAKPETLKAVDPEADKTSAKMAKATKSHLFLKAA